MLFPSSSLAVALALVNVAFSSPSTVSKRAGTSISAALSAALLLNSAVSYQVCIIASGAFAAASLLNPGSKVSGTVCVAPVIPIMPPPLYAITTTLFVTGCAHYVPSNNSQMIGGNTCTPQYLSQDGHLVPLDSQQQTTQFNFAIESSNGRCSGIKSGLTLSAASKNPFVANTWNVDCTTRLVTLSSSSVNLCMDMDANSAPYLYSTTDTSCAVTYSIYAQTLKLA